MTRVLHTGDTHLGYRQYHRPERREDFLAAFETVVRDAVELDVDAVVHAGDLFHDRRPGLPDLLGCLSALRELDAAGIPFLAVVGNHETKRSAQWLDLFEAMGVATRLGRDPFVVGDTAFYGLDFVPRARRDDLDYEFESHDAAHAALVSHGLFEPLVPDYGNVEWHAGEVLEAATVDFDAMLLGDEHAATEAEIDGVWVAYCGSTERTSAGEREARGYNLVTFDETVRITRRGLETREFVFVKLVLAEGEGFDRVRDRLREHDLSDAVVHVTLDGDGTDVSSARIETFAEEEGALVARVTDERELLDGDDVEVAFADPDEAVRERVRELGLSDAARDLDETIRESTVADSNVTGEVERRVADLLEDPDAFKTAGLDSESNGAADDLAEPDAETGAPDGTDTADPSESAGADPASETADADSTESAEPAESADPAGPLDSSPAGAAPETADPNESEGDDQASMGDYL